MQENTFTYRKYTCLITINLNKNCLQGTILFLTREIKIESQTIHDIKNKLCKLIDEYLHKCALHNKNPLKAPSGICNVRTSVETHRAIIIDSFHKNITVSEWVRCAIKEKLKRNNS